MSPEDLERIKQENDQFRQSRVEVDELIAWHVSLVSRGRQFRDQTLRAVREQDNFDEGIVGLHDFGTVVVGDQKVEWILIYLDRNNSAAAPNVAARRVMAIAPSTTKPNS